MSGINTLPHLDTATDPGEYQWCGVRVTIDDDWTIWGSNSEGEGTHLCHPGKTLDLAIIEAKRVMLRWGPDIRDRLIREHAWLLDLMRSVYDCRPDADTIMERMREEIE